MLTGLEHAQGREVGGRGAREPTTCGMSRPACPVRTADQSSFAISPEEATYVTIATALPEAPIHELRAGVRGEWLRPGDDGYDPARRVWNATVDKRPALIVRCTGIADVLRLVGFAREHNLVVAVRGGGHNVAGSAVCDGGVVLDLSRMKGIRVDEAQRTVRAQAGLNWG